MSRPETYYFPEPFDRWVERPLAERLRITAIFSSSLDRRRREYKRMGWIYAMRNPALKENVFKVGQSRRFPTVRAAELSQSTGVFGHFELAYFIHVGNRHAAETEAHRLLVDQRVTPNKEFFSAPLARILHVLDSVASRYPVWAGPKRSPKPLAQPFLMHRLNCPSCGSEASARELLIPVRARCRRCGEELSNWTPERAGGSV